MREALDVGEPGFKLRQDFEYAVGVVSRAESFGNFAGVFVRTADESDRTRSEHRHGSFLTLRNYVSPRYNQGPKSYRKKTRDFPFNCMYTSFARWWLEGELRALGALPYESHTLCRVSFHLPRLQRNSCRSCSYGVSQSSSVRNCSSKYNRI